MKILSLFSGIGGFDLAFKEVFGPDHDTYFSEIDPYAIQVYKKHFPEAIELGDITKIDIDKLPKFDFVVGGSPCQDLSIAKKNREGLAGSRSGLFWKFVEIVKKNKPKYFILENVNSMPKEAKQVITETLGVEPIMINAALVSAQNRKRLFWTNIPNVTLPSDRGILLRGILESGEVDRLKSYAIDASYYKGANWSGYKNKCRRQLVTNRIGQLGKGGQGDRIYSVSGKSVNLSANGGGRGAKTGLYLVGTGGKEIILGDSKLQVLKEVRTELGKKVRSEIRKETGRDTSLRGKNYKAYFGRDGIKANCVTTGLGMEGHIVQDFIIRKLTPVECARLQCFPDDWCDGLSNTRQYRGYGNAVNVEVVKHILSFVK